MDPSQHTHALHGVRHLPAAVRSFPRAEEGGHRTQETAIWVRVFNVRTASGKYFGDFYKLVLRVRLTWWLEFWLALCIDKHKMLRLRLSHHMLWYQGLPIYFAFSFTRVQYLEVCGIIYKIPMSAKQKRWYVFENVKQKMEFFWFCKRHITCILRINPAFLNLRFLIWHDTCSTYSKRFCRNLQLFWIVFNSLYKQGIFIHRLW